MCHNHFCADSAVKEFFFRCISSYDVYVSVFFFIIGLGLYSNAKPFGEIWAPCTNYLRVVGLFLLADTYKIRELLNCKKGLKK